MQQGVEQGRLDFISTMLSRHMSIDDIKQYSDATDEEIKKAKESLCVR